MRSASNVAISLLLFATLWLCSCSATPVVISGQDLAPQQQSQLRARRGIAIGRIGVEPTDGRLFALAPGHYPIAFRSTLDLAGADRSLASVRQVMECEIEIEFLPGENVQLSGKVRTGSVGQTGRYTEKGFHTEITLESSIEDRSTMIDTSECSTWIDCDHVDKTRMMPITCN
jgi:hypothetical protein